LATESRKSFGDEELVVAATAAPLPPATASTAAPMAMARLRGKGMPRYNQRRLRAVEENPENAPA
jgi:hypothetical protein